MRKRQQAKRSKGLLYISMILFAGMFQTSCLDEIVPGNYYTFTGETIADYLENRDSIFSDYIYCLKSAGRWGEMSSYGDYTCFAPTNSSFQKVFDEWGVENIEGLAAKIDGVIFSLVTCVLGETTLRPIWKPMVSSRSICTA